MMAVVVFCTTYALILPAITLERTTYCGLEEHTHTEECYATKEVAKKTLICNPEDEAEFVIHTHNDYCYDDAGQLICDLPELEEHIHTEECYAESELVCDKEETEGHTHTEECYEQVQGDLICTDESEEHEHTDECYDWTESLICEQEEQEAHTHDESCYSGEAELICDIPEVAPHKHDDSCYENGVISCGKPEVIEHEHTEECVHQEETSQEERVLICGKVEHTHTEECYEKPAEDATTSGAAVKTDAASGEIKALTFAYSDDEISGVVTIDWSDKLPEDLACTVVKLDASNEENFLEMSASVDSAVRDENKAVADMQLYRLEWTSNGQSYTLPTNIIPKIQMTARDNDEDATIIGAVITDKNEADAVVFKEVSGIGSLSGTTELTDISNVMLNLYSVDDDTTSEQALTADVSTDTKAKAKAKAPTVLSQSKIELETGEDKSVSDDDFYISAETVDSSDYETEAIVSADNSVELEITAGSTFAILKAYDTTTVSGDYYRRIDDASELDASKNYLIVFQNGVEGMCYTTTTAFTPKKLEIQPVKGLENSEYFTFVDVDDRTANVNPTSMPEFTWRIVYDSSAETYQLQQVDSTGYTVTFTVTRSSTNYQDFKFNHDSTRNVWEIYTNIPTYWYNYSTGETTLEDTDWYLAYDTSVDSMTMSYTENSGNINMLIYEYVGGSRTIVDDVEEADEFANDKEEQQEKPDYAAYTPVSGVQEETDTLGELHTVAGATVTCTSDASTSQIESKLGMAKSTLSADEQFEIQEKNDGRLITDKSVVYGGDDYSAIGASNYDAGDFSVALSAVGQEWKIEDEQSDEIPIDVVFIVDLSGSMRNVADPSATYIDEETGEEVADETERWQASAEAINEAMAAIQKKNPNNRVGLVEYSNTSAPVLELGRYTADNDKYLTYATENVVSYSPLYGYYLQRIPCATIQVADSLVDESTGVSPTYSSRYLYDMGYGMYEATYTQRGLQEAYEMFARNNDTTYTLTSTGETVKRQPVIILVTDGDPTYCTYNYMDPKSGPNYGLGACFGIESYYSILSANYFKNLTSIHYGKQSAFYTIGMGILSEGYGNVAGTIDGYDDSYRRAVLNPTDANIAALSGYKQYGTTDDDQQLNTWCWQDTSLELQRLLEEKCEDSNGSLIDNGQFVEYVNATYYQNTDGSYYHQNISYYKTGLGYTSASIRGIANPYKNNYNYTDAAFFGNLSESDMEDIFDTILQNVQTTNRYDFLLKSGSNVTITDSLGDGMIVKGEPVLMFYGNKYSPVTHSTTADGVTYYWTGTTATRQSSDAKADETTVDLSGVTLAINTDSTGAQTVVFTIPENALPTFYPDNYKQFYYEELPIRAIYRVGLSLDEEAKLNTAAGGAYGAIKDKVYYTNKYSGDTPATTVTFYPDDGNPYYESDDHKSETIAKAENASGTTANSFIETVNADGSVTQLLGNNGKLVLNRAEKMDLTVKKVWEGTPTDSVSVQLFISGTRTETTSGQSIPLTAAGAVVELNAANNWQYTWTLPKEERFGTWVYNYTNFYVSETPMDGYTATYKDKDGNLLQSQEFTYTTTTYTTANSNSASTSGSSELNTYSVGQLIPVTTEHKVDVVAANGGEVTIVNSKQFELPESGGIGTRWFTLSGMTILIATSFLYIQSKRKQRKNRLGGEA
jgi:LPXTG-motif cell wall-anchored protein